MSRHFSSSDTYDRAVFTDSELLPAPGWMLVMSRVLGGSSATDRRTEVMVVRKASATGERGSW